VEIAVRLKRTLGLFEVTLSGIGIILGAGIYALIGEAAGLAGNAVWISFAISSLVALFTGLSYAELAPMFPKASAVAAVKTPFVDVGGAAEKILSKAEEMDVSLIALSSAGKGYLDALTTGSVVFDVARMGKRPVLVVRSGR
jgi:nucleotide-binding universal stress UspA family protein